MLVGDNYVSRFGSSALVNLGLQDLVAGSSKEYVEIAVRLAGNSERLQSLHRDLRSMIERSPLLDAAKFTRNLEAAYRQMWVDWCGGGAAPRADAMPRAIDNRAAWGK
jgi:predicted O-linked N-acetylglucosamine transferase (SPINDLY family)